MSQPGSPGMKAKVVTEVESKTKTAIDLVKASFNDFKKEFNESTMSWLDLTSLKSEIKEKLGEKKAPTIGTATDALTKYYMYSLNEASLGLYFSQFLSKKMVKEMFDSEVAIEKDGTVDSLNKYKNLAKTMEMETRELASLKDDWATSIGEKLTQLTK